MSPSEVPSIVCWHLCTVRPLGPVLGAVGAPADAMASRVLICVSQVGSLVQHYSEGSVGSSFECLTLGSFFQTHLSTARFGKRERFLGDNQLNPLCTIKLKA